MLLFLIFLCNTDFLDTIKSSMINGESLNRGTGIMESKNLKYQLSLQGDGNLVLRDRDGSALWASGSHATKGSGPPYQLKMEHNNALVLYDSTGNATWTSGTAGMGTPGMGQLSLQDDGSLIIHDGNTILWSR